LFREAKKAEKTAKKAVWNSENANECKKRKGLQTGNFP
jgi:hypothetical protein